VGSDDGVVWLAAAVIDGSAAWEESNALCPLAEEGCESFDGRSEEPDAFSNSVWRWIIRRSDEGGR
jgi:hypothetical protein